MPAFPIFLSDIIYIVSVSITSQSANTTCIARICPSVRVIFPQHPRLDGRINTVKQGNAKQRGNNGWLARIFSGYMNTWRECSKCFPASINPQVRRNDLSASHSMQSARRSAIQRYERGKRERERERERERKRERESPPIETRKMHESVHFPRGARAKNSITHFPV